MRKPGKPPPEAKAGRKVILGFMGLGVNDMKYNLEAMQRVYERERKAHEEMTVLELERMPR